MTRTEIYSSNFRTPILFLIYNRPDKTQRVFDVLRKLRPENLFVAADGARKDKPDDWNRCMETRNIVSRGTDWKCDARFLYRDENLGCRYAVSSAITWFFQEVDEGIVLEEDCLPGDDFFGFCAELLSKYRHNDKVYHIGGCNLVGKTFGGADYYFSIYNHIWGWATWRRAWMQYDVDMADFMSLSEKMLPSPVRGNRNATEYWMNMFSRTYKKQIDTWDYQWTYAMWKNGGLAIIPARNLVSNIGFGENATHTREVTQLANMPISRISFPLRHAKRIRTVIWADRYSGRYVFNIPHASNVDRMRGHIKRICKNALPYGLVQLYKARLSKSMTGKDRKGL